MDKISYLFLIVFFGIIITSNEKPLLDDDIGGTIPVNARSIALYKLHLTAVPTSYPELLLAFGQLIQEFGRTDTENLKLNSLLIVRSWSDDVEDIFDAEFNFPSKEDMLKTLFNPDSKTQFLMKIDYKTQYVPPNTTPKKKTIALNSLNKFSNIHTVKWLYYLMFCKSQFADKIRNILNTNGIQVLDFCSVVGTLHEKLSTAIHNFNSILSAQQIIQGLMLNGIDVEKTRISQYVFVMIEIMRGSKLYEGTLTTLSSV